MGLMSWSSGPRPAFAAMKAVAATPPAAIDCGGKVDTNKPTVTIDVPDVYYSKLRVKGAATDPTTRIRNIELWVDGKKIGGQQDGASFDLDWYGSKDLSYGPHKVELRAVDEAFNEGVVSKTVTRVDPTKAGRTVTPRVTFKVKKKGRKFIVTGRILGAATGDFTEKPKGGLRVFFEWKRKKKFVEMYRTAKGSTKPIKFTWKATRPGTWRVRPKLNLAGPYKNIKVKSFTFKVK